MYVFLLFMFILYKFNLFIDVRNMLEIRILDIIYK